MSKASSCRYCSSEIVFAKTLSGHTKALNPERVATSLLAEFDGRVTSWVMRRSSKQLVATSDLANLPFWSYLEHKCGQYLEAQTIEAIPKQGERGLVKIADSYELQGWLAQVEAVNEIHATKQARRDRETANDSEPVNATK